MFMFNQKWYNSDSFTGFRTHSWTTLLASLWYLCAGVKEDQLFRQVYVYWGRCGVDRNGLLDAEQLLAVHQAPPPQRAIRCHWEAVGGAVNHLDAQNSTYKQIRLFIFILIITLFPSYYSLMNIDLCVLAVSVRAGGQRGSRQPPLHHLNLQPEAPPPHWGPHRAHLKRKKRRRQVKPLIQVLTILSVSCKQC